MTARKSAVAVIMPVQLDETSLSEAEMYASRSNSQSTDVVFEREWAASLARQALDRLAQEYELGGKGALFEALKVSPDRRRGRGHSVRRTGKSTRAHRRTFAR